ncbi:MAG: hypothetical protein JO050_04535, partial [Acidimicrobiia bacterium]|nr:hypothetical protein [Acidimicrobiia bacterium]
ANGGTAGKLDQGDTATITYSKQLNASTMCAAWTSNSVNQSVTNATVTIGDSGSNDTLNVSTATCTFHMGTIVIGDWVQSGGANAATFTNSTLLWNPVAKTLTITMGTLSTGVANIRSSGTAIAPKYTPDTAIADIAGNTMANTQFTDSTVSSF